MNAPTLADRVADVRAWARSRIAHCQREEAKFGNAWATQHRGHGPPQALVEAWTERRSLQAVLDQLGDTPRLISIPARNPDE